MHPYISEQLTTERVRAFHQEAAAGRRARAARRATGSRWRRPPARPAPVSGKPVCEPAA
jgi:hypothetical protein